MSTSGSKSYHPSRSWIGTFAIVSALPNQGSEVAVDLDRPVRAGTKLTGRQATALFDAMVASRHLDLAARYLRREEPGLYTIGSAGHESNAAIASALRPTDPALFFTALEAFTAPALNRSPDRHLYAMCCLGLSPPPTNRSRGADTRCSAMLHSP